MKYPFGTVLRNSGSGIEIVVTNNSNNPNADTDWGGHWVKVGFATYDPVIPKVGDFIHMQYWAPGEKREVLAVRPCPHGTGRIEIQYLSQAMQWVHTATWIARTMQIVR